MKLNIVILQVKYYFYIMNQAAGNFRTHKSYTLAMRSSMNFRQIINFKEWPEIPALLS